MAGVSERWMTYGECWIACAGRVAVVVKWEAAHRWWTTDSWRDWAVQTCRRWAARASGTTSRCPACQTQSTSWKGSSSSSLRWRLDVEVQTPEREQRKAEGRGQRAEGRGQREAWVQCWVAHRARRASCRSFGHTHLSSMRPLSDVALPPLPFAFEALDMADELQLLGVARYE